jgi:hypothetical protein
MVDADAMAPTIDVPGTNARTFFRTPLVGYATPIGERFRIGISVELPSAKITGHNHIVAVPQIIPDIPAFIQYKSTKGHLKLAGVLREIYYGTSALKEIKSKRGWGLHLSGSIKPASMLTLYAQGIYGKGVARYINDLGALSLDLLPDYSNPGHVDVQKMFSAAVGLRANVSKKVYVTSNFGFAQLDKNENFIKGADYRQSKYLSASFFWNAYQNLLFATEYLHGYRKNMNADSGNANRIQAMLRYSF